MSTHQLALCVLTVFVFSSERETFIQNMRARNPGTVRDENMLGIYKTFSYLAVITVEPAAQRFPYESA